MQFQYIHLPVSDFGSLERDPSLLMVLMTKFFSRVKLVRPTDSELSMTNTMSRAPQRFSQSAGQNWDLRTRRGIGGCSEPSWDWTHHSSHRFPWCSSSHRIPVGRHIYVKSSECFFSYNWHINVTQVLTVRPGSPSGPGSPCRTDHIITSYSLPQKKCEGFSAHSCALTLRPMSPLGPLWPGSPWSPGSPWHEKEKVTWRSARKYLTSVVQYAIRRVRTGSPGVPLLPSSPFWPQSPLLPRGPRLPFPPLLPCTSD